MKTQSATMHVPLDRLPSSSSLFLDYIRHSPGVRRFFAEDHTIESIQRFARSRPRPDPERLARLANALEAQQSRWGGDGDAVNALRAGAVAVVSGQQAGLFTGPLFSVMKALTALKLARLLEREGVPAVPVFWIAADDHDYEEIRWAAVLSEDAGVHRVQAEFEEAGRTPAGWLRYGPSISGVIEECFGVLPQSEFANDVRGVVEDSYRPRASPVDAFGRMMARLFEGTGIVLADSMDPALRDLGGGMLERAARQAEAVRRAVQERSREIGEGGYPVQVRVDDAFTGLFVFRGTAREPWRSGDTADTAALSPNVLLRPVFQDSIFPTAAYIAGPSEVAYLAQASAAYEVLDVPMPPIVPRLTATLVEPKAARVMRKYDFGLEEVFDGPQRLRERAVGAIYDTGEFDAARERVRAEMEGLRGMLTGVDPTLGGALDNAVQKVAHQFESLKTRFISAESRRNEVLDRQLDSVMHRLFPEGKPQERVLNVVSFLVRYGMNLGPLLEDRLVLDGGLHQVIEL